LPARPPRRARGQSRSARDDNHEGHGINAGLKAYSTKGGNTRAGAPAPPA